MALLNCENKICEWEKILAFGYIREIFTSYPTSIVHLLLCFMCYYQDTVEKNSNIFEKMKDNILKYYFSTYIIKPGDYRQLARVRRHFEFFNHFIFGSMPINSIYLKQIKDLGMTMKWKFTFIIKNEISHSVCLGFVNFNTGETMTEVFNVKNEDVLEINLELCGNAHWKNNNVTKKIDLSQKWRIHIRKSSASNFKIKWNVDSK